MPNETSFDVPTALSSGAQKLGQPVPLSNFVVDEKRSSPHPAHANVPRRFSCRSSLVKGGSVASCRRTSYASGFSSLRHSASVCVTSKDWSGAASDDEVQAAASAPALHTRKSRRVMFIRL